MHDARANPSWLSAEDAALMLDHIGSQAVTSLTLTSIQDRLSCVLAERAKHCLRCYIKYPETMGVKPPHGDDGEQSGGSSV
jgi:hypothetical protein